MRNISCVGTGILFDSMSDTPLCGVSVVLALFFCSIPHNSVCEVSDLFVLLFCSVVSQLPRHAKYMHPSIGALFTHTSATLICEVLVSIGFVITMSHSSLLGHMTCSQSDLVHRYPRYSAMRSI